MPNVHLFFHPRAQECVESQETNSAGIKKPFKCTECDSWFTTKAALNIHTNKHDIVELFRCSVCPYVTTCYNDIREHKLNCSCEKHKIRVTRLLRCRTCDYVCHTKPMMKSHLFSTHTDTEKLFQCTGCDFETLKINSLESHVQQKHSVPLEYACNSCNFVCNSQTIIHQHIIEKHSDHPNNIIDIGEDQDGENGVEKTANIYACVSCDFMCSSLTKIKNHISEIHSSNNHSNLQGDDKDQDDEKLSCPECDFQCSTKRGIEVHMAKVHKYLIKVFNLGTGHVKYKQNEALLEPKPIGIDPDPDKERINELKETETNCDISKPIGIYPDPGKKSNNEHDVSHMYECTECTYKGTMLGLKLHKRCHKKGGLKLHRSHKNGYDYKEEKRKLCTICGAHFYTALNLKLHMNTHKKCYSCKLCDFKCETKILFQGHMDTSHYTARNLDLHMNNHKKCYSCKVCDFKCEAKLAFQDHMATAHGLAQKLKLHMNTNKKCYSCKSCDFKCETILGIQGHMVSSHSTAVIQNSCPKCNYTCSTTADLQRHISKRHVSIHEPKRQFACPECDEHYEGKADLINHMLSMNHTGGKPFACTKCKAQFLTAIELHIHIKSHVPETNALENCEEYSEKTHSHSDADNNSEREGEHYNKIETSLDKIKSSNLRKVVDCHAEGKRNSEDSKDSNTKIVACSKCNYKGTVRGLAGHTKVHKAEVKKGKIVNFRCSHKNCDFMHYTYKGIIIHEKLAHKDSKKIDSENTGEISMNHAGGKLFSCTKCKGQFLTGIELKNHMKSHVPETDALGTEDEVLNYDADNNSEREGEHDNIIETSSERRKSSRPRKVVDYHIERKRKFEQSEVSNTKFGACNECNYKGTILGLKKHKKSHTAGTKKKSKIHKYRCIHNGCNFMSYTYKGLVNHTKSHKDIKEIKHQNTDDKKHCYAKKHRIEKFRCFHNDCDFVSITPKGIKVHAKAHYFVKPFACKECDFTCFTQKVLNTHIGRKHGDDAFACPECDYIGNSLIGFSRHSNKAHNIQIRFDKKEMSKNVSQKNPSKMLVKDKAFVCNEFINVDEPHAVKQEVDATGDGNNCFIDFKVEEDLIQVVGTVEGDSIKTSINLDPNQTVKEEMDTTGDDFDYKMDIKVEEHPIQDEIKPEIEPCTNLLVTENSRSISYNTPEISIISNSKSKYFHCQYCDYSTVVEFNYYRHLKTLTHINKKAHQCPHCDKSFVHKKDMVSHQKIHTGENPHQCSNCGKCFARKYDMERHQIIHTGTGEKPYKCSHCDECFAHEIDLLRHQAKHTGL